jgi:hypothetical protein
MMQVRLVLARTMFDHRRIDQAQPADAYSSLVSRHPQHSPPSGAQCVASDDPHLKP